MFHESVAAAIQLRLESGRREQRSGIGGIQKVWVHPVQLFVGSNLLEIEAAFTKSLPFAGLLGRRGFFEHFKVTFDPSANPPGLEIERILRA